MSRSLDDLVPGARMKALQLLETTALAGLSLRVTSTRRTRDEQAALYAKGRSKPGKIVTWARPGTSVHETGQAFDIVPMVDGAPVWEVNRATWPMWEKIGQLGEAAGLEWGGRWRKKADFCHFQSND